MTEERPTVVVAMSGGVDSSVAAALLVEKGYRVIGMMLQLWSEPGMDQSNRCCTPDAMYQARRVAAILGIPFYVVDAKEIFRREIVQPFIDAYLTGETPNPCYYCNQKIRWGHLLAHARAIGADYLATGHYARVESGVDGRMLLRQGLDEGKDQSYILSGLNQDQLMRSLFPIGEYHKTEVRKIAEKHKFPTAERPDSQDLCFLAGQDYRSFIGNYAPEANKPGRVVNRTGEVVGEHKGLAYYTIGQRKGIGGGSREPTYVVMKDVINNTIQIGNSQDLYAQHLETSPANWVSIPPQDKPFRAEVKIRYKATPVPGIAIPAEDEKLTITFDHPVAQITPGQLAVIYSDDHVLASGKIIRFW